jgi:hypothetical protein
MDNENINQEGVLIKSYAKTWQIESRIYAIFNFVLPFPVTPWEIFYFALSIAFIAILCALIPPLTAIPALVRYTVLPFLLTRFLARQKVDGMNPLKFFGAFIAHMFTKSLFTERFTYHNPRQDSKNKIDWWCSRVEMSDRLRKR